MSSSLAAVTEPVRAPEPAPTGEATAALGLRERKRRATRRAIEFAVLELTRDHGFDQVTVDEISRVADISPRTFFNYFPSKDAALIGDSPFVLDDAAAERFAAADPQSDVLADLFALVRELSLGVTVDLPLHRLRLEVMRDYPELFAIKVVSMRSLEAVLTEVIERRLAADAAATGVLEPSLGAWHSRALLIALVSLSTMRHAWGSWAESGDPDSLPAKLDESFRELQNLF
jgi:AcrR family transcriptional regulator